MFLLQDQIEEAYRYVLSKINLGAEIEGLYRQDMYEMPMGSIREIIANAVTHRNYLEPGNVQVALYDNRLEVTSPGMLLNGVTIEKIREGYSKVRNRAIANAFSYMRIIEEWGSGNLRMFDEFSKYGLVEQELVDMDGDFRVNFYRKVYNDKNVPIKSEQALRDKLVSMAFTQKKIDRVIQVVAIIINDRSVSMEDIAKSIGVNSRTIKRDIDALKEIGVLGREGSKKTGKWIINID